MNGSTICMRDRRYCMPIGVCHSRSGRGGIPNDGWRVGYTTRRRRCGGSIDWRGIRVAGEGGFVHGLWVTEVVMML